MELRGCLPAESNFPTPTLFRRCLSIKNKDECAWFATRRRRKSETSHSSEVINSCVTARVARPAETLMDLVTFCQDSDFPFVSSPQAGVLSDSWMLANRSHSRF